MKVAEDKEEGRRHHRELLVGEQLLCVTRGGRRMRGPNYRKNRLLPPSRLSSEARLYTTQRNRLCYSSATSQRLNMGKRLWGGIQGQEVFLFLAFLCLHSQHCRLSRRACNGIACHLATSFHSDERSSFLIFQIFNQPNISICSQAQQKIQFQ